MVPSSVSKMNTALPDRSCAFTTKPPLPLKTRPVGAAGPGPEGTGIVTTSGTIDPAPVYSVERPVPLSAIQTGLVALKSIPHAFTRRGSRVAAQPGTSETRLVWLYFCALAKVTNPATRAKARSALRTLLGTNHDIVALLGI